MSMQDAFQYFTRVAQLVAEDSVPGAAPRATPAQDRRGPAALIKVIRARLQRTSRRARPQPATVALAARPGPDAARAAAQKAA